jgi:hypothetical protein
MTTILVNDTPAHGVDFVVGDVIEVGPLVSDLLQARSERQSLATRIERRRHDGCKSSETGPAR